ncbi:jg24303 [Pararge aegeria aegeria]|uniref:Jg24303 protein n=1 Tax=Pararge aegeria aegeria TaxID=348720 RepID=A0A8S4SDV1_9NEOP|nr:jg24303 [Pararge aegeria aegeria]
MKSTPDDRNYVGAVVEYMVNANSTVNLQNYIHLLQDAALQNADIIVFPELALTSPSQVEIPLNGLLKDYPIPALQPELYDEFLVAISSAAIENDIYVVINLEELLNCTSGYVTGESCPEQKVYIFSTNVVFDRSGAVIDRYRKINLFGELTRTPALSPELGIFETDFGVTFGHLTSLDLLFQVPAIQMVQKHNITNIIFPVRWASEMPFLTAVSIQQAYAVAMNVNLLAAGANDVGMGKTGSGIYSGRTGSLVSVMTGIPTTRLLVSRVPKTPGRAFFSVQGPIYNNVSDQDNLQLTTDLSLPLHTTRLLEPKIEYQFMLSDTDILCSFYLKFNDSNAEQKYRYRATAFSGVRTYNQIEAVGSRLCAVIACTDDTIESCGKRFPQYSPNSTAVFEILEITAAVPIPETDEDLSAKNAVYFPVTLDTSIMPLKPADYLFEEVRQILDSYTVYLFVLRNLKAELYSFGLWGREFSTDGETTDNDSPEETPTPDSACIPRLHIMFLFFAILALAL